MRINVAIPEPHVDAPVLDAALEATTRLNERMLAEGEVPTFEHALSHRRGGIRWQPEPPGAEHFDHAQTVMVRGWGDCDDLAPWHAASLRHTGEDPGARAVVKRSGPKRWHAIVRRSDGSHEDPSREAGMGKRSSTQGVVGAALPLMPQSVVGGVGAYIVRPQIALRPVRGAWQARADLPWHWRERGSPMDHAMTTLHTAPVASTALVGALDGAVLLGESAGFADDDHMDRLSAIADLCDGADFDEVAEVYGDEHAEAALESVVGFFGGLGKVFKKVTKPLAAVVRNPLVRTGLSFVPGGSAATTAFDLATQAARAAAPAPARRGLAAMFANVQRPQPVGPRMFPGPVNLRCVPFG